MIKSKQIIAAIIFSLTAFNLSAQVKINDDYLIINAKGDDPLFTTYAASMERSRFFADKAYFMDYFSADKPLTYSSQYSGELAVVWKINNMVISKKENFAKQPVVITSFPDMAILEYELFEGLHVQETFFVYSSGAAIIDLHIQNRSHEEYDIFLYPLLHLPEDSLEIVRYDDQNNGYLFTHYESTIRLHSNLYKSRGYPTHFRNLLACNETPDSYGGYQGCSIQDFYFAAKRFSKVHAYVKELNEKKDGAVEIAALQKNYKLKPGQSRSVRFVRGAQDSRKPISELVEDVNAALKADIQKCVDENVQMFKSVPRIKFKNLKEKTVYLGAFNLVRQCMLPPRDKTQYNYYVFSREPVWGWGHGHQVMHESLSMLSYVYLDAKSAQESQRIYIEQQYEDGLIGYRYGPRGPQVYPHEGKATTSAPFFSWTNWEIYKVSKDKQFLRDAYDASVKYIHYLEKERDQDGDGMFEWGPYGIIENVRDGWNVVFQLFSEGEDEGRDISDELDALDLTTQTANEMYYLKLMAKELGDEQDVKQWREKFEKIRSLINKFMWDKQDKFYYHVAMKDNSFLFEGESLKRKEIIGLLTLWARIPGKEQAGELVNHLKNEDTFWRKYGVPTLAADDPHYTAFVDGCCRWNGPIWLLWDYMLLNGLQNYGYKKEAKQLADKMMLAVTTQLERNHRFWESFSPDYPVQECPSNYIWDSIMAKVLIDVYGE
ncbi:MAG: hypothetical protein K8R79_11585 [Calditrichales bacterium]|nr:hypothetical protein [Calditrichales bacterium]